MRYKNIKTGAVIDSPCDISGGDWVLEGDLVDIPVEVEETFDKEEPEEAEETEEIRLSELTVAQLKDLAEELEIDLGNATKKDDIIAVMLEAEENSAE